MIVYRIEHITTKRGPYAYSLDLNIPFVEKRHPTISEELYGLAIFDSLHEFYKKHDDFIRFGFNSLDKLKCWFSRDIRRKLKKEHYIISVYNVPKKYVFSAEKQLIFSCKFSKLDHKIDLSTLKRIINDG